MNSIKKNHKMRLVFLALAISVCALSCEENNTDQSFIESSDNAITTVMEFKDSTKSADFFNWLSEKDLGNHKFRVFIKYGETTFSWPITADDPGSQQEELLTNYQERLEFLINNFNPEDSLEKPVYDELTNILDQFKKDQDVNISKVEIQDLDPQKTHDFSFAEKVYTREGVNVIAEKKSLPQESNDNIKVSQLAITDYDDDANHVPVAGTSTFYSDGILHKFWFDGTAVGYYDSSYSLAYQNGNKAPAFEIDSLFKSAQSGSDVVECGNDSAGQAGNLPDTYVDTELFDGDTWRVCTVGTQATSSLQTWYLYWTWRSLDNLQTGENPVMRMNLQPSERCSWCSILNYLSWPAYCTCAVGYLPPSSKNNSDGDPWLQSIISYYYNEAPGYEEEWYRD